VRERPREGVKMRCERARGREGGAYESVRMRRGEEEKG